MVRLVCNQLANVSADPCNFRLAFYCRLPPSLSLHCSRSLWNLQTRENNMLQLPTVAVTPTDPKGDQPRIKVSYQKMDLWAPQLRLLCDGSRKSRPLVLPVLRSKISQQCLRAGNSDGNGGWVSHTPHFLSNVVTRSFSLSAVQNCDVESTSVNRPWALIQQDVVFKRNSFWWVKNVTSNASTWVHTWLAWRGGVCRDIPTRYVFHPRRRTGTKTRKCGVYNRSTYLQFKVHGHCLDLKLQYASEVDVTRLVTRLKRCRRRTRGTQAAAYARMPFTPVYTVYTCEHR